MGASPRAHCKRSRRWPTAKHLRVSPRSVVNFAPLVFTTRHVFSPVVFIDNASVSVPFERSARHRSIILNQQRLNHIQNKPRTSSLHCLPNFQARKGSRFRSEDPGSLQGSRLSRDVSNAVNTFDLLFCPHTTAKRIKKNAKHVVALQRPEVGEYRRVAIAKCEINVDLKNTRAWEIRASVDSGECTVVLVQWICVAGCCEGARSFLDLLGSWGRRMEPAKALWIYVLLTVVYVDGANVTQEERGACTRCCFLNRTWKSRYRYWRDVHEGERWRSLVHQV